VRQPSVHLRGSGDFPATPAENPRCFGDHFEKRAEIADLEKNFRTDRRIVNHIKRLIDFNALKFFRRGAGDGRGGGGPEHHPENSITSC
jgi:hypothetical protein